MRVRVTWHEKGYPKREDFDKFPSQIGEIVAALIVESPSVLVTRLDWRGTREPRVPSPEPKPVPDVAGRDITYTTLPPTSSYGTLKSTTAPYAIVDGREVDVMGQPL